MFLENRIMQDMPDIRQMIISSAETKVCKRQTSSFETNDKRAKEFFVGCKLTEGESRRIAINLMESLILAQDERWRRA